MSELTIDEMNRRIAARDAARDRTDAARLAPPVRVVRTKAPLPPRIVVPFCALCVEPIVRPPDAPPDWAPRQEPLGRDDALVLICEPCATGAVRERDHLFGSHGGGVGEGNRRISSRYAVKR